MRHDDMRKSKVVMSSAHVARRKSHVPKPAAIPAAQTFNFSKSRLVLGGGMGDGALGESALPLRFFKVVVVLP